ncbi:hypothetical protein PR202_ga19417 [Eleusine coracana subsp. coracana]|uniref:Uncharacterized protein n=1 Tax=Eleusine coracana subsp. coracana TaxID=191504 RepID=A0AAV5CW05_ELECO|nr:hypothetical protein PR202_ga19417 [Eleusine coracana subsp. coracana]
MMEWLSMGTPRTYSPHGNYKERKKHRTQNTSLAKLSCLYSLTGTTTRRGEGAAAMWAPASPGRLPAMEECGEDLDVYRRTRGAMASCWGRFGVAALWRRLRQLSLARRGRRHGRSVLGAGGLNYDPLSYAQNFDDGGPDPEFTARFAPARHVSPDVDTV